MSVKEIRDLYSAAPFQPFELGLTNPEFMMFSGDFRTVCVADERDGATKRLDVKTIIAGNESKNGARPRKRK